MAVGCTVTGQGIATNSAVHTQERMNALSASLASRPILLSSLLGLATVVALAAQLQASTIEGNLQKSFTASPGGKLIIDADRGSIEVSTTKGSDVQVQVFRKVSASSDSKAQEILDGHKVDFAQEGNTITIRAKGKNLSSRFWNFDQGRFEVRFVVSVPDRFNGDLKTSGGSIKVADLTGELRAHTSGGSLDFGRIHGQVNANTSGGSIRLMACLGHSRVETSGGSIDVGEGEGELAADTSGGSIHVANYKGPVVAHTSGGGISIDQVEGHFVATTSGGSISATLASQPTENCRLETSGGNITVKVKETVALNVDAETSGGRVSTELPVTVVGEHKHNVLRGTLNGGGKDLVLHTSGGSIHLKRM